MNNDSNKPRISGAMMRAVVTSLGLLAIGALLSFSARAQAVISGKDGILAGLPNFAIYLTISIGDLFILNSLVKTFAYYDKEAREIFLADSPREVFFGESVASIFKSRIFWIEAAVTVGLVSLIALIGGFPCFGRIFFEDGRWDGGWFPAAILAPCTFILLLLAKYEARRYWVALSLIGEVEKKLDSPLRFIGRIAVIVILYPVIFPFSPLIAYVAWNFVAVIIQVTNAFSLIGTILGILVLTTLVYIISFASASSKRKKFLKRVSEICAENGYEVALPRHPSLAILRTRALSFKLTAEGKDYDCTLLPTLHKRTPFVINSATGGYFRHRIGTKSHHYTINHNIDFYPSSEGERIVILSPTPKYILISEGKYENKLTSGDRVWNFVIYSEESFASALDRKCLGRANRDK